MGNVEISELLHKRFGRCVMMANGAVELMVTVDFGPRIIHYATVGMDNVFYEDAAKSPLGSAFPVYGGDVARVYGGHRLWASPEVTPMCYYPDNAPVSFETRKTGADEGCVVFTAPMEKVNNIQKSITVTMPDDAPSVSVFHSIENLGNWEIELAPWCLTMLCPGAKEVLPMPARETGLLPNRNFTFWPYSDLADPRLHLGRSFITLTQDAGIARPFKLGYNNEDGWAAAFTGRQVFLKFFEPEPGGAYPDNGCCFETYVNGSFLEAESLGEFALLAPGEAATAHEQWELYPESRMPTNDEKELAGLICEYIER